MKDFDIVIIGQTTGGPEKPSWIDESEALGCTWYAEVMIGDDFDKFLERIVKGPYWKKPPVNTCVYPRTSVSL